MLMKLPVIGTADEPAACLGDPVFDDPRTGRQQADCQAICRGCTWRTQCHQAARALVAAGEQLWGVWAGRVYSIDSAVRIPVTPSDPGHDTSVNRPNDRQHVDTGVGGHDAG